jgi:four helix bundle protein
MPKYEKFEDLPVWQESCRLYQRVLDLLEEPALPLSPGFRNQLDRAALAVSSNIAEGFERPRSEVLSFLSEARARGGEVRSMIAIVKDRPKLRALLPRLEEIRALADSCAKQLGGWARAIESPASAKRSTEPERDPQPAPPPPGSRGADSRSAPTGGPGPAGPERRTANFPPGSRAPRPAP